MWHIGIYSAWCFLLFIFEGFAHYFCKYSFFILSFLYSNTHMLYLWNCPSVLEYFIVFLIVFFYFHFSSRSFYWHIFKVINSFHEYVESVEEPIESISGREFLISKICFPFSLIVSILLLVLFICFCMLSTFFIRVLNLFIILILNSLPNSSNICDICNSSSSDCFSLHPMFFVFFFFFWHDMQFFVERWTFCLG